MTTGLSRAALLGIGFTMIVGAAGAQTYPNRPVRIVTSPAGGGNDFAARLGVIDQRKAAHQFNALVEALIGRDLMLESLGCFIEAVAATHQPATAGRGP